MKRLVLGVLAVVLSLGWVGPSEAGSRGHGGGHHGGHHGHHFFDDHDYALFLLYGAPHLLSALTGWNYPARAATRAPQATGYVEQTGYWYYCTDPEGYHPYVKDCPQGWMQVVPSRPR